MMNRSWGISWGVWRWLNVQPVGMANQAFDFDPWLAKVEQQIHFGPRATQVVQGLGYVGILQLPGGFQLQDHATQRTYAYTINAGGVTNGAYADVPLPGLEGKTIESDKITVAPSPMQWKNEERTTTIYISRGELLDLYNGDTAAWKNDAKTQLSYEMPMYGEPTQPSFHITKSEIVNRGDYPHLRLWIGDNR